MPAVQESAKVDKRTIDEFLSRVKARQPVHPQVMDAVLSSCGIPKENLACLTNLEYNLVVLHSLAARKYLLSQQSASGYEPWESSLYIWQEEEYPEALKRRIDVVPLIDSEIRILPPGEKSDYLSRYGEYLAWLGEMTGNSNDPIPESVLLLTIGMDTFPEVPHQAECNGRRYFVLASLSKTCREMERRKVS